MIGRYVVALVCVFCMPMVHGQATVECQSAASDADGDGFGWENGQSCRVTDSSADIPEFVNQRTGQPVLLERAFWDARDFLPEIICRDFYFDGIDYQPVSEAASLLFESLPLRAPFQSRVRVISSPGGRSTSVFWRLENGIYTGPTALGETPWVEITTLEFSNGFTQPGVRAWTSDFGFTTCATANPNASFGPTGIPADIVDPFNGECIDTPPTGDGWGWDGLQSCRIGADPECFDSPPVGDGWGWNGSASCRI